MQQKMYSLCIVIIVIIIAIYVAVVVNVKINEKQTEQFVARNRSNNDMINTIDWINKHADVFNNKKVLIDWIWNNMQITNNNRKLFAHYDLNLKYMKRPYENDDYDIVLDISKKYNVTTHDPFLQEHEMINTTDEIKNFTFIHNATNNDVIIGACYIVIIVDLCDHAKTPTKYIYGSQLGDDKITLVIEKKLNCLGDFFINEAVLYQPNIETPVHIVTYQIFKLDIVKHNEIPFVLNVNTIKNDDPHYTLLFEYVQKHV